MRAFFRICVNENPPGLQQVEKLAMPLKVNLTTGVRLGLITEHSIDYGGHKSSAKWCLSFLRILHLSAKANQSNVLNQNFAASVNNSCAIPAYFPVVELPGWLLMHSVEQYRDVCYLLYG